MEKFFENAWGSITELVETLGSNAADILIALVKIVGIIILARIVIAVLRRISNRVLDARARRHAGSTAGKKAVTIKPLSDSIIKYAVYFLAFMAILGILGLDSAVTSLLAAAGVGGIVIAFGAQSLVKDVFSGLFMLLENQYAVGDYIEADGEKGTVETIALRTTSIKKFTGETATIPNGSIGKVINYSRGDHLAVIDVSVSYDTDIEKASQIMQTLGLDYMSTHDNILEEPHVLGIMELEDSGIALRMILRVKPLTHWETERALRRMIVEEFARQHVEIPYPHRVIIQG
jgi:small conductance mechanosensitive channel